MYFVDIHRVVEICAFTDVFLPFTVTPFISADVKDYGCGSAFRFRAKCVRVRFQDAAVFAGCYGILLTLLLHYSVYGDFPYAAVGDALHF